MKEDIENLNNQDLLDIYRLLLEHKDYLESEKKKLDDENNEE